MKKLTTIVALALAVSACTVNTPAPAPVTVTQSESASPSDDYEDSLSQDDKERIGREALQMSWDESSAAEQEGVCDGYESIPNTTLDTLLEGNEDYLTREDAAAFLDENC